MNDLRIQIVNYRTLDLLIECLTSLVPALGPQGLSAVVAVLDNGSGDDLGSLLDRFPELRLELHQGRTNVGYGAGHNLLARGADARFLLLLNPDVRLLDPLTLHDLIQVAMDLGAQVVGPRLVTGDGQTQRWDHGEIGGWSARLIASTGNSLWRERSGEPPLPAAWVAGAAFLIVRRWYDELAGFDERFFLYKEDEELCLRVLQNGGRVIYHPGLTVLHHCSAVAVKADHLRNSTDYFLEKHFRTRFGYHFFRLINAILH
ncbi:glycosyltransferase family 2 protein [Synechococcus sp. Cruz-9H2]|uniref:glycosyltransferase n=1 Tax=unclassified Synechococcus TaxID=2626047 RepID=UPI0020CE20CC|nr:MULTISPECIES: glycosyltransferase family 2 protein [unclassified Synechococcus]MCP9820988.1 glycosyltransferase family 2 protein [Synechococcus sp. Cruz-9H2]MCP9845224.1 glycosyltransferase family 2 protein [Synechococcus sp. Edmonson 11F2]MCP9857395.1 glycosyltransferase family 2 protein [Synechococcus sp. Cruz-9C9]MCP9864640.1 glycosyltransferase family 2 protein [Synechococcus sp. Cruz-7E5]MCP9871909.1 glycosyltransferase family 2 protein [Synechococcus sp. Cruz-7B9]